MTGDGIRFNGVQREYDWEETTPTYAILETLSIFKYGTPDRTEAVFEAPLHDFIDPDGLRKVVNSSVTVTIEFTLSEYAVQISGNQVSVASADSN